MIVRYFTRTKYEWSLVWQQTDLRNLMLINILLFAVVSFLHIAFLQWSENRNGYLLHDWLHRLLPPADFSLPIFILMWGALLGSLFFVIPHPFLLFTGLLSFTLMFIFRSACIFFVPLEAPQDLILLSDPIAGFFLHQDNLVVKNDLFFSGHTASLCILFILLRHTPLRLFLLACACVVPLLIVWQRVHYSIDVLCAPPAAWVCVYVAKEISTPLFFRQKNDYNRLFSLE